MKAFVKLKTNDRISNPIIGVRGKAPKARQTTDGGVNPRANCINKTKPRKGDRTYNVLNSNMFRSLSPRWGFFGCRTTTGGSSLRSGAGGGHPRLWSLVP